MKTPLFLLSALSFSAFANQPIEVNPQITDAVTSNQTASSAENPDIETIVVTADFRQADLMQIPSAITVVGDDDIQNRSADHLESILSLAPNVNFASGSSRARFFQIRGIGERSQFIDPVNPSVGLIIDGIDMTGLGGAATLFDIEQVEILRGPQGTAFGANALAGAINIKSKQPTKETEGYLSAKLGNYNTQGLGGAISGSLTDDVQARFAINQTKTDGYMNNIHLNRKDTNNIDEIVARAQLNWQINDENEMHFSAFKTDINNGYDAFSLDNNRNTYSNKPGKDEQDTTALSIKLLSKLSSAINLELSISGSHNKSIYGYDEDWAYGEYDENTGNCDTSLGPCLDESTDPEGAWGYSTEDYYYRENNRKSVDVRALSGATGKILNNTTDWVIGATNWSRDESLDRQYTDTTKNVNNQLRITSSAIYSELNTNINADSNITYGLRAEKWSYDFSDSNNIKQSNSEELFGGKITLESLLANEHLGFITIAKGYKAGGINSNKILTKQQRTYETETNYTIETGLKSSTLEENLNTQVTAFYILREDQQVKQSFGYLKDGKPSFKDYIANAAEGENYGLELEANYKLNKNTEWAANIGHLKTKFKDFSFLAIDPSDDTQTTTINKDGRPQAHAPEWSFTTKLTTIANNWKLTFEAEGKEAFYFSDSHDVKSSAFVLLNTQIEYTEQNLKIALNIQNIADKDYTNRGFWFGAYGNDPRKDYAPEPYTQLGNPRLITLSARYDF